jgi:hypothetical protein
MPGSPASAPRTRPPARGCRWDERGDETTPRSGLFLVLPTTSHLQQLSAFASADELLAHATGHEVHPVQPRGLLQGETARIVLPGEPGYET